MLYKVGDKVRVKPLEEFNKVCDNISIWTIRSYVKVNPLDFLAGQIVTITYVCKDDDFGGYYHIEEDPYGYCLDDTCFEGLAEEYTALCERSKNKKVDDCEVE